MINLQYLKECHEALIKLPHSTIELEKIRQYIENQTQDLGTRSKTVTSNFILASGDKCSCLECTKVNPPTTQSSILQPVKFLEKLLPFLYQLNDQPLQESISQYDQSKCVQLKRNLAMNLISQSFDICLNKETFSFKTKKFL